MAKQYEIRFRVKGISGIQKTIITANDPIKAKQLLKAQYGTSQVSILNTKQAKWEPYWAPKLHFDDVVSTVEDYIGKYCPKYVKTSKGWKDKPSSSYVSNRKFELKVKKEK